MSTEMYIVASVGEGALLILVLAFALIRIRRRLTAIASGLATLGSSLAGTQRDLRLLAAVVPKLNAPLAGIAAAMPGIADKAEAVAPRFRAAR